MRAKNIHVGYCRSTAGLDYTRHRETQRELAAYKAAREQGIQPAGTHQGQVDFAVQQSDKIGRAWDAGQVGQLED